jgi:hypothetical protein
MSERASYIHLCSRLPTSSILNLEPIPWYDRSSKFRERMNLSGITITSILVGAVPQIRHNYSEMPSPAKTRRHSFKKKKTSS